MIHGKAGTYNNHGCRCDKCKMAWAAYLRPKQQQRRREAGIPERGARPAPNGTRIPGLLADPMSIRLTERLRVALMAQAARDGVSLATTIRQALEAAMGISPSQ